MWRILKLVFSAIVLYVLLQLTKFIWEEQLRFIVWTSILFVYIYWLAKPKERFVRKSLFDYN